MIQLDDFRIGSGYLTRGMNDVIDRRMTQLAYISTKRPDAA